MAFLPENTILGHLKFLEVYEEYDGPRLFSCRNAAGQIYIAVWVDESHNQDIWLYAPISSKRFSLIRTGAIELREIFLNAEDGYAFAVIIPYDQPSRIETIACNLIEDKWLIKPGEYLNLSFKPIADLAELQKVASSKRRDIIHILLDFPHTRGLEAPIRYLGNFLNSIQGTIDAIANTLSGNVASRGRPPITETQLALTNIFPGSFGVELTSLEAVDLFGNSLIGNSIDNFIRILNSGSDSTRVIQLFNELQGRPATRYRELLNLVLRSNTGFSLDWGSPNEEFGGSAELLVETAQDVIKIIEEIEMKEPNEFEVVGKLIGINVRIRNYELAVLESRRKIAGRIMDEAMEQAGHATVNNNYVAIIREVSETNQATGEVKYKYQLMSLLPLDESYPLP